jgi:hypothetical protein
MLFKDVSMKFMEDPSVAVPLYLAEIICCGSANILAKIGERELGEKAVIL